MKLLNARLITGSSLMKFASSKPQTAVHELPQVVVHSSTGNLMHAGIPSNQYAMSEGVRVAHRDE